jgi:branched-chain amino acid transport system permease protein
VVAGLGNLPAILAAAAGLGIAEQYAGFVFGAQLQTGVLFSLLVVILVARSELLKRQRRHLA